jgi:hypothetical protein
MKRFAVLGLLALAMSVTAMAAEITGFISDAACAGKKGAKAATEAHAGCAEVCIKGGSAAVLVTTEGKVYKIADQDKVKAHAGKKVTITGSVDGDTVTVESVKADAA